MDSYICTKKVIIMASVTQEIWDLVSCCCCEDDSLFKLFDKKTISRRSFNLCLNCFHVQREEIDSKKYKTNDHINPEWMHRYLCAKYGDNRIGMDLLEISSGKSKFKILDNEFIKSQVISSSSITEEYIKKNSLRDFIVAENLLDTAVNPKKMLDSIADCLNPTTGIAVITLDTDIDKNISVFSGYSLSTLSSRCGLGVVDIFKIKHDDDNEIIVAFVKKFEPHTKSLDRLIQEEEIEGRYNIGSYYEDNLNLKNPF